MNQIADITLETNGSAWLLFALCLLAAAFSIFIYRRTVPPVSPTLRGVLAALRMAAMVLVILLLFEPILSVSRRLTKKPVVAVLIDNSASMSLQDEIFARREQLKQTLNASLFQDPSDKISMQFYPFSHSLQEEISLPDSMALDGDGTDIQLALKELKEKLAEEYFAAVVLLTDGGDNLGSGPARLAQNYGIPIYPVAIGDPAPQRDILVSNYVTNEIAYAGNQVPVDVYIKGTGFKDRRIQVKLLENNKTIDTQFVTLTGSGLEQKVRLSFPAERPGLHKFDIQLPKIAGELTSRNNTKSFYTKVLKSKIKTLIVAGAAGPDFLFLKRTLLSFENIEVTQFIEKKDGTFYQGNQLPGLEDLQKFDAVLLVDYPRKSTRESSLKQLLEVIVRGKPVLLLAGRQTDVTRLASWQGALPFEGLQKGPLEKQAFIKILPQGLYHPLLRLSDDDLENNQLWQELPPIYSNIRSAKLSKSSRSLAVADRSRSGQTQELGPMITALDSGKRKSVAILAYGLWRWDLMMWGAGKSNTAYKQFVNNIIRWLTTSEDSKLVKVTSNKEIYRSGETIEFSGQVYFEDFRPVNGAEVALQLRGKAEDHDLTLTGIGNGRYEGNLQILAGGDYEFTATAHQQGRILGRDSGKFSVEPFNHEYQNTQMNQELLQKVAVASGGAYFTSEDFSSLAGHLTFPEQFTSLQSEWEIRSKVAVLFICLGLLVTEWFIRKRKGML